MSKKPMPARRTIRKIRLPEPRISFLTEYRLRGSEVETVDATDEEFSLPTRRYTEAQNPMHLTYQSRIAAIASESGPRESAS